MEAPGIIVVAKMRKSSIFFPGKCFRAAPYPAKLLMTRERSTVPPETIRLFAKYRGKRLAVTAVLYRSRVKGCGIHFGGKATTCVSTFIEVESAQRTGKAENRQTTSKAK
jgi:hypothetical protein